MPKDSNFGKAGSGSGDRFSCGDFDQALSDALDGSLTAQELAGFQRHVDACPTCGPIFAETQAGLHWLKGIEPVEVPANLVHNILAATSVKDLALKTQAGQRATWLDRAVAALSSALLPVFHTVRQPRFALNAGMAFFSVSLLLNVSGVRLSTVRLTDLAPSAIKKNAGLKYDETTAKVVKYYENLRFVYELESTVRELKRATTNAGEGQKDSAPKKKDDNTTQQPDKRNENYSRGNGGITLAAARTDRFQYSGRPPLTLMSPELRKTIFKMQTNDVSTKNPRRLA